MIKELYRFGVVGFLAALVHVSLVIALVQALVVSPLIANVLAFGVAFQVSYWGHRHWTFPQTQTLHRDAFLKLMIVQIINFAANETLFYIFLMLHLPYPLALILVLSILPVFTFISSKLWVFR